MIGLHTAQVPRATAPVLVLAGQQSNFVPRDRLGVLDTLFAHSRVQFVEGAGHWVHHDQRDAFLKLIRGFV